VNNSLVGKPTREVRSWTACYIEQRKLDPLTVDQLIHEAMREQGTYAGVTKTKIRRAASRLVAGGMAK